MGGIYLSLLFCQFFSTIIELFRGRDRSIHQSNFKVLLLFICFIFIFKPKDFYFHRLYSSFAQFLIPILGNNFDDVYTSAVSIVLGYYANP